jgi:hypothetical protein
MQTVIICVIEWYGVMDICKIFWLVWVYINGFIFGWVVGVSYRIGETG